MLQRDQKGVAMTKRRRFFGDCLVPCGAVNRYISRALAHMRGGKAEGRLSVLGCLAASFIDGDSSYDAQFWLGALFLTVVSLDVV